MPTSADAQLVADFEGWYACPYNDPVGHCTIGYGHLLHYGNCRGGEHVPGSTSRCFGSRAAGLKFLVRDLQPYEDAVKRAIKVPLTPRQLGACTSLAFNIGTAGFASSTVARRLNAGDYAGAAAAFLMWTKAGGMTLPGLVRRRREEVAYGAPWKRPDVITAAEYEEIGKIARLQNRNVSSASRRETYAWLKRRRTILIRNANAAGDHAIKGRGRRIRRIYDKLQQYGGFG